MTVLPLLALLVAADAPRPLSIEEVIALSQSRSASVDVAKAGLQRADADGLRAWSEWLPQANASLTYDRTILSEWDALSGNAAFQGLPFGQLNTWRAGVLVTQNVFAGGRSIARVRSAEAGGRLADIAVETAAAQALLDAVQAYYDAVLAERLLGIAAESLKQAELTAEQTRLGNVNGTTPDFDVLRAEVTLQNQRPELLQRQGDLQRSRLRLKQLLELPSDEDVTLTSTLDGEVNDITPTVLAIFPTRNEARAPVREAEEAIARSDHAIAIAAAQHLPQIDVNMSYAPVAYPNDFFATFDDLRYNWTVGASLQVPLFTGLRISGDVERARADRAEALARLRLTQELVQLDTRTSESDLTTAVSAYASTAGVVEQARRAYSIAQLRYRDGISTLLELNDARLQLDQAEVNRARAARDLQVARVRIALLPSLPAPGGAGAPSAAPPASVPSLPPAVAPTTSSTVPVTAKAPRGSAETAPGVP